MKSKFVLALTTLLVVGLSNWANSQGILVNINPHDHIRLPRPTPQPEESSYKIHELSVQARLADQVARVQVSQSFVNTGSRQMEVCFVFPLPYDGAVDQLTLLVDGKEFPAKLLDAKEARKTYEEIVRKNKDPALLEWLGTGMFKTSVFPVPAGATRKITLRYSQLCRASEGLTDFLFPLSTAKFTSHPVEKVSFHVAIESEHPLKNIYSPSHSVEIKRPDDRHAVVSYETKNQIPSTDFRLFYDVGSGVLGTKVISYRPEKDKDGYFMLLASPEIKSAEETGLAKTIVFVVDRSGSMSGKKIDQAKDALKFVLNNLKEGDLFNIVAYDSDVESFRPELQKYNEETRSQAIGFVEGVFAGGSTNIDAALKTALTQLKDDSRPNFLIFLTDGLPTAGERNEQKIAANAKDHNSVGARVFTFGVGYDVNSRLLDKLAREGRGLSHYVRPDDNIEDQVSKLYARIGSPVMTETAIRFEMDEVRAEEGEPVNRLYPKKVVDLFAGEQLVLLGRYRKAGTAKVVVTGKVGDKENSFDFPATFVEHSGDETYSFIEKLWVLRRIGEIIDELDLNGRNEELIEELVALSTRHGIITPYTSFLADENVSLRDLASNTVRAEENLFALEAAEGQLGFRQRRAKNLLQNVQQLGEAYDFGYFDASGRGRRFAGGIGGGGALPAVQDNLGRLSLSEPRQAAAASRAVAGAAADVDSEESTVTNGQIVQTVGRKAFYKRGDRWIDSTVTEEQEKKLIRIERYSEDYFDLVEKHGKEVAQYLAMDEPVVIQIDGQAYAF